MGDIENIDTQYTAIIRVQKNSNKLFLGWAQSYKLLAGKVREEYLFSNEERAIAITPLWKILYEP